MTIRWQMPAVMGVVVALVLNALKLLEGAAPLLRASLIAFVGVFIVALVVVLHRANIHIARLTDYLAEMEHGVPELPRQDGRSYFEFCQQQNSRFLYRYTTPSGLVLTAALLVAAIVFFVWAASILVQSAWDPGFPSWLPGWLSRWLESEPSAK